MPARRALREAHIAIAVSLVALLISLVANVVTVAVAHRQAREGKRAHTAICVLRADFQQRIDDTNAFLKKHPNGIPGLASRSDLLTTIANQKKTVAALTVASCSS